MDVNHDADGMGVGLERRTAFAAGGDELRESLPLAGLIRWPAGPVPAPSARESPAVISLPTCTMSGVTGRYRGSRS